MAKTENVTYGKPKVGGAVSVAPLGTVLPTDAKTALNEAFKNLGYISEDGLNNENSPESEKIKAWGGEVVLATQTEKPDTFTYKLIEALNTDVLKEIYGDKNVTGTLETGITVEATSDPAEPHVIVEYKTGKQGLEVFNKEQNKHTHKLRIIKRIVIPNGVITEIGEINYTDEDAIGYEVTIEALPISGHKTHTEYIVKGE